MIKKGKFIFMFAVLFVVFTMLGTVAVNAANKIVFEDNDNPDYVTVLSLDNEMYTIEIDEETGIGYVIVSINGDEETLGTWTVVAIDSNNPNGNILCYDQNDSLGTMTIIITNENIGEGYISVLTGELSNLFNVNQMLTIEE